MPRKPPKKYDAERGPGVTEDVCVGEDVKIGIHLAIERFRQDESKNELTFPSSFSINDRAYVHRYCDTLGCLKTKSSGRGPNRSITITKKKTDLGTWKPELFSFTKIELGQVSQLLQKFPVNDREREDLCQVAKKKTQPLNNDKTKTNRLANSEPQVPPKRSGSDLNKFRQTLPVFKMGQDIMEKINSNRVCLIAGETGSGKTTQVPQIILDDCHEKNVPCRILCTQPRRIAALSIAERVAAERGEKIGAAVGYLIRLESKVSAKTVLTFCTAGVVLRTLLGDDANLATVTHILVDEVHERDKFVDFLLLCLKEALPKYPNLRIILMSATLNMELFSKYFNDCPVVCVPGNLHDVEEFFLEDVLKWTNYQSVEMKQALARTTAVKSSNKNLSEFFTLKNPTTSETVDSDFEDDSEVTTTDNAEELGEEKDSNDLDPAVQKEMDELLQEAWLTGNKELFHQILHLIASENISVDYAQSDCSITALMIAAGRGFSTMVEHLLDLGANINAKTINQWTAIDFARHFEQLEIVELLQAYALASETSLASSAVVESEDAMSEEDRRLVSAYQQTFDDTKVDTDLAIELILNILNTSTDGAILVFLPGIEDINTIHTKILGDEQFRMIRNNIVVYSLHSSIQSSEQKKVFKTVPKGVRKIILSTNIAETSVTIDDVVYVIDSGKVKEKAFDSVSNFSTLMCNWISKASALQRRGRAGRVQSGKCYHLFSRSRYMHLQDYPTPELLRLPLQEICLHAKLLAPRTESVVDFVSKCPQAPAELVISQAVQSLKEMDAFDPHEDLTELGHHLVNLPVEPQLGKMLLFAVVMKCLDPVTTIVATMAYRDPFVLPTQIHMKRNVINIRRKLADQTYSDHFVSLRAFQLWQKSLNERREFNFSQTNSLSPASMHMIQGIRNQILNQLKMSGFVRNQGSGSLRDLNTNSDNWPVIKACLVAGIYPNVIQKRTDKALATRKEKKIKFHYSSVVCSPLPVKHSGALMFKKKSIKELPSRWVVYDEMCRTGRCSMAKGCTVVSPLSVFLFAGPSRVPKDALKSPENSSEFDEGGGFSANMKVFCPDSWLTFHCSNMDGVAGSELRIKLQSLFLTKMKFPHQAWSQTDEAVLRTVTSLLTSADVALGFSNPLVVSPPKQQSLLGCYVPDNHSGHHYAHQRNHQQHHQQGHRQQHYQHQQYPRQHQQRWNGQGHNQQASGGGSCDVGRDSCFFIMKAANHKLLEISQTKNFWATSTNNEGKLSKSFLVGKSVFLIFSVQGSGHFQGFAKLASAGTRTRAPDFSSNGISAVFQLEWIKSAHLPFQLCHHLLNPWNENKKVQESRDGQELEPQVAIQLLQLWHKFHHQLKPFKLGQAHKQRYPQGRPSTGGHTDTKPGRWTVKEGCSRKGGNQRVERKDSQSSSPSTVSDEDGLNGRDNSALSQQLGQLGLDQTTSSPLVTSSHTDQGLQNASASNSSQNFSVYRHQRQFTNNPGGRTPQGQTGQQRLVISEDQTQYQQRGGQK